MQNKAQSRTIAGEGIKMHYYWRVWRRNHRLVRECTRAGVSSDIFFYGKRRNLYAREEPGARTGRTHV